MIKINKTSLKTYKFGDIASNISERAEPKETKLDIYVGLEHLDPDCIHIKRRGHPSDVKGTKLRVYPGDIIFGKRRAYQRKAGIVDFDGICSAHAMVVRANPKVILPELLPFFMHSDAFMHRAVDVSEGSLSPTIKWKILADQEFTIPTLGDQNRIADLLWSIDATVEKWKLLRAGLDILQKAILKEKIFTQEMSTKKIGDFGDVVTGKTPSTKNNRFWNGGIPFVTPSDMSDENKYVERTERYITDEALRESKKIPIDSLLVVCIASIGKLAISTKECITNQQINAVIGNKVDMEYLYYVLRGNPEILKRMAGHSVVPIIKKSLFEGIEVPCLPDSADRGKIVAVMSQINKQKDEVTSHILKNNELQKDIVNEIFG